MYIELGSTKINYKKSTGSDFIILSQVVNSSLSYEKPVIVNNVQDFDIWFGRDFSDRDFLVELLEMGISLYLYKPVNPENSNFGIEGYIDYSSYSRYPRSISYYELSDPNFEKNKETIYSVITDDSKVEDYIWDNDNLIKIKDLPQNQIPNNTKSLNNRDTLVIFEKDKEYYAISPTFENSSLGDNSFSFKNESSSSVDITKLNYERLSNNLQTCAYNLTINEKELFDTINEELNYLILGTTIFGFGTVGGYTDNNEKIIVFSKKVETEWLTIQENLGPNYEYIIKEGTKTNLLSCFSENQTEIYYLDEIENIKHLYNISGFTMDPDFNYTNNVIYDNLKNDSNYINKINFISKTIGTGGIDGDIEITIEVATKDIYRVWINRFGYSEVFEGKIIGDSEDMSLEDKINNYSKLVYCEVIDKISLPIGKWVLRGGVKEKDSSEMYLKSLDCLCNPPEPIYFDYLLIPDVEKYPLYQSDGNLNSKGYYEIYNSLIQISKSIGCQILIQNSIGSISDLPNYKADNVDITYRVDIKDELHEVNEEYTLQTTDLKISKDGFYVDESEENLIIDLINILLFNNDNIVLNGSFREEGEIVYYVNQGNYLYNYLEDTENRLIYFYGSINVFGEERPGYYLYLMNLFLDTYSATSDKISYTTPVQEYYTSLFNKNINDDLTKSQLLIVKELENKKCNYLLSNNHIYYYEKYQNGSSYSTTGWMRFCIEKIKRELMKNKWLILDSRDYSKIVGTVEQILGRIKNSFSIIKDIKLADLEISYKDKKIDIKIDSTVSDLVNNGIRIDVTLNYNA